MAQDKIEFIRQCESDIEMCISAANEETRAGAFLNAMVWLAKVRTLLALIWAAKQARWEEDTVEFEASRLVCLQSIRPGHVKSVFKVPDVSATDTNEKADSTLKYGLCPFDSKYAGTCACCGEHFPRGTVIRRFTRPFGAGYVHEACFQEGREPRSSHALSYKYTVGVDPAVEGEQGRPQQSAESVRDAMTKGTVHMPPASSVTFIDDPGFAVDHFALTVGPQEKALAQSLCTRWGGIWQDYIEQVRKHLDAGGEPAVRDGVLVAKGTLRKGHPKPRPEPEFETVQFPDPATRAKLAHEVASWGMPAPLLDHEGPEPKQRSGSAIKALHDQDLARIERFWRGRACSMPVPMAEYAWPAWPAVLSSSKPREKK